MTGYELSNLEESKSGFKATLKLVGDAVNAYGEDIASLIIEVEHQTETREFGWEELGLEIEYGWKSVRREGTELGSRRMGWRSGRVGSSRQGQQGRGVWE